MLPIEPILKYPVIFLTGLVVSLMLTRFWGPRAPRWGFVDRPGGRKLHSNPTPTAGGIALFLGVQAAFAMVFLYPWKPFAGQITIDWWLRYALLSSSVGLLGLVDDRISLKPMAKLLGQIAIAVAAYCMQIRFQGVLGISLPGLVDFTITVVWFLVWMNAFNLIDGVDGLATGIALIAASGMAVSLVFRKSPGDVLLFLGFVGACAGFLRYNFHPARVFLGDTGSLFLGFSLAMLAMTTNSKGTFVTVIGMPLLAVGVPLFDTMLAIWRRTARRMLGQTNSAGNARSGIEVGDAEHLHHRLLRGGLPPHKVALVLYAGTAVLVAVGLLASLFHDQAMGILSLAFLIGCYVIVRHLAWIEMQATGDVILQGVSRPERRNRAMLFYVAADLIVLNLALLLTQSLLGWLLYDGVPGLKHAWLRSAPLDVGIPFAVLALSRSYSRIWYLARVSEYALTALAAVFGYALVASFRLIGMGDESSMGLVLLRYWLLAGLAVPLIVGVRAVRRVILDLAHGVIRARRDEQLPCLRALVCGTGWRTTLFLNQHLMRTSEDPPLHIVGLVDHDAVLRRHFVHGIRVLGALANLDSLLRKHSIDRIYVTEPLDAADEQLVREAAAATGANAIRWHEQETPL